MADATGRQRRGGVATDPPELDLDDFAIVPATAELSRANVKPTRFTPLVEKARANLNQKLWQTRVVMDGDSPVLDESNGQPKREAVTYSKAEAQTFVDELRAAADKLSLPRHRQSLRIIASPKLKDAKDDDQITVQFYVIPLGKSGQDGNSSQPATG